MKALIIIGILLAITGATLASGTGVSGSWMMQVGLIYLLGAIAVSKREGVLTQLALLLMVALFLWGFVNGIWYEHPLGAIISIIGGSWVLYRIAGGNEHREKNSYNLLIQKFAQKRLPIIKLNAKWVGVPLSILLTLWLFKSIFIAFIIGFGIVIFLDKQSIQVKGVNYVAVILMLYTVGFLLLLAGVFKIDVANNYPDFMFFNRNSYLYLRDIMQGL